MGFDNEETGAKKKYCRKTTKLFVMMIASIPKRERKLPALPKKKEKKKKERIKPPHLYSMNYAQFCIYPLLFTFWKHMLTESMLLIS